MRSPAVRLAITLFLALLVVVGGDMVLLPGMADLVESMTRRTGGAFEGGANLSIFALGIMPAIEAYGVVELVAFVVPKWSRLRHGNPEGRAKLERASRLVAILFAAFQAFGIAQSLAAIGQGSLMGSLAVDLPSTPIVMSTLVGGVCVQIVVAEIISRLGIANGYVLLTVVDVLAGLRHGLIAPLQKAAYLGRLEPRHYVLLVLVFVLPAAAAWIALRGGDRTGTDPVAETGSTAGPYRAARALAIAPWVPVPSSSLSAYALALGLVGLPLSVVSALGGGRKGLELVDSLMRPLPVTITIAALTGGLTLLFARLLHRPNEMAEIRGRLGFSAGDDLTSKARAALSASLLPTLLFFATLVGVSVASGSLPAGPSILFVPMLVALVMDVVASLRTANLVPVWEERRASVVPVVRAVLAAEGIDATVRGLSVLSLLQVFAPYAPAEIMVAAADAPRATALLRHVFLGEKRPEAEPTTDSPKTDVVVASWTPARRTLGLVATAAFAFMVLAAAAMPHRSTEISQEPRTRLEVVRVDDESDVFEKVRDADVPQGIELRFENAPVGRYKTAKTTFARGSILPGESYEAAFRRMRKWCDGLTLPEGKRIGLEPTEDYDPDTNKAERTGVRTFILTGTPILTTEDVVEALPSMSTTNGMPEVYVAVTLSPESAERFRVATSELVQRRIAIIVDDHIESAPVVKSEIGGGRISITMGAGDPDRQLAQAQALARSLTGH